MHIPHTQHIYTQKEETTKVNRKKWWARMCSCVLPLTLQIPHWKCEIQLETYIYFENAKPLFTIAITCTDIFHCYSSSNLVFHVIPLPMELISRHINRTYHGLFIQNHVRKCRTTRWHNTDKPFPFWQFTFDKMQITFGSITKNKIGVEIPKSIRNRSKQPTTQLTKLACRNTSRNFSMCFCAQVDGNFLLCLLWPMF